MTWVMTITVKNRLFAPLLLLSIYKIENQTNILFAAPIVKIGGGGCNN